jgi:hypothetical protein
MGKIYFVFQEESILGLLKNYAAAGKFGLQDVEYLQVKDNADYSEKGSVITEDDAVVYVDFQPDCERARIIAHELKCPVRWCDEAGLKMIDVKQIFRLDQQAAQAAVEADAVAPVEEGVEFNA